MRSLAIRTCHQMRKQRLRSLTPGNEGHHLGDHPVHDSQPTNRRHTNAVLNIHYLSRTRNNRMTLITIQRVVGRTNNATRRRQRRTNDRKVRHANVAHLTLPNSPPRLDRRTGENSLHQLTGARGTNRADDSPRFSADLTQTIFASVSELRTTT